MLALQTANIWMSMLSIRHWGKVLLALPVFLSACSDGAGPETSAIPVASITVTPEDPVLQPSTTLKLTAVLHGAGGEVLRNREVVWSSDNESIATVDSTGTVAPVQNGEVLIRATSEGKEASTSVLVPSGLEFASIDILPASRTLLAGADLWLDLVTRDAAGNPLGNTPYAYWTTSDPAVAWFDGNASHLDYAANGLVTFGRSGSATITTRVDRLQASVEFTIDHALWKTVSEGPSWNCGVTTDGRNYCWPLAGLARPDGQLATTPSELPGTVRLDTISAGSALACGLSSGALYCWGEGGGRVEGGEPFTVVPARITELPAAKAVAAGYRHACALDPAGLAWCWGYNLTGQLGNGTFESSSTPVAVAGGHHFRSIDAGFYHTCGVTVDDELYCWGSDEYGQLGNAASNENCLPSNTGMKCSTTPDLVAGGLEVASVSTGRVHSCAINTAGAAYCWGSNDHGAIGSGTSGGEQLTPVPVAGGIVFSAIGAGWEEFTCGLDTAGKAWCWGNAGMLGAGVGNFQHSPIAVSTSERFTSIDTGGSAACALTADGVGWCWGDNVGFQLGVNGPKYNPTPIRLPG